MGLTVVDAGVLIGHFEAADSHHRAAREALEQAHQRRDRMVIPAAAYAELMVMPARTGASAVTATDAAIERLAIDLHVIDRPIARSAARLRAMHRSLKLPDALVIATAIELDADILLSTDRRWPSRSDLGLRARVSLV